MKRSRLRVTILAVLNLMLLSCGTDDPRQKASTLPQSATVDSASKKTADSYAGDSRSAYDSSSPAVQDLKRIFRIENKKWQRYLSSAIRLFV